MKTEIAYHKNSDVIKWKRITHSNDFNSEYTYNEQGKVLTFKNSNDFSCEYIYNEQGKVLTFKDSDGYSSERTYNEQGQKETFKDSNGIYVIKGEKVSKEEFEAFVNDEIIELNGIKYKRI
jgi:YD repeat-containing protein